MPDLYTKVGTNLYTSFVFVDATGAPVTGLLQSAFTLQVERNGVGNQSNAGITITEIDSTNNPGEYSVVCSGTSSFLATTGNYDLIIFQTSTIANRWAVTIRVTSDGTGAGSWGDAAFTAIAGNGRIISGGSPLQDATVKVVLGSVLYVQATTDVNGLYGTIYFPASSGTYTISVQKSGYAINSSSTISVVGSVATGPGIDISLTAATAGTSTTASSLWQYAKRQMKDASGAKADQEAKEIVDDAICMISTSKCWPWLMTIGQVTTNPLYSTGTVALTNGSPIVTLTGGTFPAYSAQCSLYGPGGQEMPVLSMQSSTQITLATNWGETTNLLANYVLGQHTYALPLNLLNVETLTWGTQWPYGTSPVSWATISVNKCYFQSGVPRAYQYALGNNQLLIWPLPTEQHVINITYYRRPTPFVSGTDTLDFDPNLVELVRRAIDYQVSLRRDCAAGTKQECMATYQEAWARASDNDHSAIGRTLGVASGYDPDRPFKNPTIIS